MPSTYYDKIMALFDDVTNGYSVAVTEIQKAVEQGDNSSGITKEWLYSLSKDLKKGSEAKKDPGIKRMDALYRVLRKIKTRIDRQY